MSAAESEGVATFRYSIWVPAALRTAAIIPLLHLRITP
jgi:hypothetical protein